MNLRQMEVFRAVMLTGSIRGAAEVLHVSQPAVSKLLAHAARQSRLVLFERVPTTDTCCLWFEVVEGRIGGAGRFVGQGHKTATKTGDALRGQPPRQPKSIAAYVVTPYNTYILT